MKIPTYRQQRTWLALLALVALSTSGCTLEGLLGTPEQTWLWLAVPLAGFLFIGGTLISLRRRSQLSAWDMAAQSSEPSMHRILLGTVIAAILLVVVFVVLNLRVEIDPGQRLWNMGLWALGTILGSALSLFLGLRFAEPTPRRS